MRCYANPYEGNDPFIFFSYCHEDAAVVYPIIEYLSIEGFRVWYDDGIHPGDDWPEVIAEHLDKAKVCVAAISANSAESHNCRNELSYAVGNNMPFLSILLYDFPMSPGMRLQLSVSKFIRRYELPEEEFYQRIAASPVIAECRNPAVQADPGRMAQWRDHVQMYQAERIKEESPQIRENSLRSEWFGKRTQDDVKDSPGEVINPVPKTAAESPNEVEQKERETRAAREAEVERLRNLISEKRSGIEQIFGSWSKGAEAAYNSWAEEEASLNPLFPEARLLEEQKWKEAARKKAEEEAARKKAEEEAARKKAEEEARKKAEEEARKKAEEEARKKAEEEADDEETIYLAETDEDAQTIIGEEPYSPALLVRMNTGEAFVLAKEINTLGRSEDADLSFSGNKAISRKHAEIIREGSQLFLHELGATYGTELDGVKIERGETVALPACAELKLSNEQFFLVSGDACDLVFDEGKLCILKSRETGETKILTEQTLPLNRYHKWRQNVLGDKRISRENHAEIYWKHGSRFLRDMGSVQGTFCNGRRLKANESVELHNGDTVAIVETVFQYYEVMIGAQS